MATLLMLRKPANYDNSYSDTVIMVSVWDGIEERDRDKLYWPPACHQKFLSD